MKATHKTIDEYNSAQNQKDSAICNLLREEIDKELTSSESKIWHSSPVWFLDGNPIVGYSKQKPGVRLMFWSGQGFDEEKLDVRGERFKDASIFYNNPAEVDVVDLKRWLKKAKNIQWDYKNIVKRKGKLIKLKGGESI